MPERTSTQMTALLDEITAAELLHLSVHTLRSWRSQGIGPSFHRLGRRIRYSPESLQAFLRETLVERNQR
ncbi:MAG: helix-turn-helix domain-containing protein [Polyangiales bacterium]